MSGYTKLFSSIVHSTIWREEDHVRIVWITMLALADRFGVVEASIPGLADAARVDIEQCKNALCTLSAPDEYSRCTDYDGRRIEQCNGGWLLLNYTRYRDAINAEKVKEQTRDRVRRHRAKARNVTVTPGNGVTLGNADPDPTPDPDPTTDKSKKKYKRKKKQFEYTEDFLRFWEVYPNKKKKKDALIAWLKADDKPDIDSLLAIVEQQKTSGCLKDPQFCPLPPTWLNAARWEDEIDRRIVEVPRNETAIEGAHRRNKEALERIRKNIVDRKYT